MKSRRSDGRKATRFRFRNPLLCVAAAATITGIVYYDNISRNYHHQKIGISDALTDSDSLLYGEARHNVEAAKKWVEKTLKDGGVQNLFGDVVIVTPENASRHVIYGGFKNGRNKFVTHYRFEPRNHSLITQTMPVLYVPIDAFSQKECDTKATILFHEARHAQIALNGLEGFNYNDFVGEEGFNKDIYLAATELDSIGNNIKNAEKLSEDEMDDNKLQYEWNYVQLLTGENVNTDSVRKMLMRYYRPWMTSTKYTVCMDLTNNNAYCGPIKMPFVVCGNDCYAQFEVRNPNRVTAKYALPIPQEMH